MISKLLVSDFLSPTILRESRGNSERHAVFAQDPVFVGDDNGQSMRKLFFRACATEGVDAVGSTPYVESTVKLSKQNINWIVDVGNWIFHFPFVFYSQQS